MRNSYKEESVFKKKWIRNVLIGLLTLFSVFVYSEKVFACELPEYFLTDKECLARESDPRKEHWALFSFWIEKDPALNYHGKGGNIMCAMVNPNSQDSSVYVCHDPELKKTMEQAIWTWIRYQPVYGRESFDRVLVHTTKYLGHCMHFLYHRKYRKDGSHVDSYDDTMYYNILLDASTEAAVWRESIGNDPYYGYLRDIESNPKLFYARRQWYIDHEGRDPYAGIYDDDDDETGMHTEGDTYREIYGGKIDIRRD